MRVANTLRNKNNMMKLVFSTLSWFYTQIWFSDIAIAMLGLFIFTSLLERLTNKGPMLWPLMGITPSLFVHIGEAYDWMTRSLITTNGTFHYRGLFMGGAHGIVTCDPSKIEYMLKTNFKNFPKGKYYKERFLDLLGNGIFNSDGEIWKEQRRIATSEMHSYSFVNYSMQTIRDLVHEKLLKIFERTHNSIDLQDVLLRFTFDNICKAAFGVDPECLSFDLPDVPFAKAFEEATELTLFRFMVPPFVWKSMKFFGVGFEKQLKKAVGVVHDFAEKTVKERRRELDENGELKNRFDLLSRIMENEYQDAQKGKKVFFTDVLFKDFCISFILAGRDTSSVGLAWFFWLMTKHPQIENKILAEINDIISQRGSKREENDIVFTVEELKKMVYLQAAISESLRLYPPVPIEFKEVQEEDVVPNKTLVKKGDRVIYSIFSMARTESIWGENCEEFKPERWIKSGEIVRENQFKYAVFNGGPRLCIGKKFAYMQMKMVAASVLWRYTFKVVEGHVVVPKVTTTLYMKNGLLVTLEPRLGPR